MAKNNNGLEKDKKKKLPFNVLSKKGLAALALAGVMIASPLMLAGCSNGQDGKDGTPGTIWKSGTSYTQFTDAKVGDYFIDTDDYILYQKTADSWSIVMENYGRPGPQGNPGQNGTNGTDGTDGTNGTNGATWLTGTVVTGTGTGIVAEVAGAKVGDLYFNTTTQDVYQCTATNTWSWISNLKGQVEQVVKAKPVIFDTDFWTDVDDAVAIRVLLWAEQHGMCDIVGMIVDAVNDKSAVALSRFLDHEGRGDLPFAIEKDATVYSGTPSYFDTIINNWNTGMYSSNDECIDENNGEYYVELLRNVPDGEKCNIICVGYGSALAGLMNRAEADEEIMNLVKNKVDKIYMMAGTYPSGSENNFNRAGKSRQAGYDICTKTPSEIPIIFLGYEIGSSVITGGTIDDVLGTKDLLAQVLTAHGSGGGRSSWDPMTTLLAVYDNPSAAGYNLVQGTNSVNAASGANTFTENSTGNHYYVTKKYRDTYYQHAINSIVEKNAWEHREVGRITYDPHSVVGLSLQSISIETQPTITDYLTGETFSTDGMVVKANYFDENTGATRVRTITNYSYSPENFTTTGQQQVTISYTHEGITKTAEVSVNVSAPAEYTISVTNANGTSTGDTTIIQKQTASVTLIANDNYTLPATITVTGAEYEYNSSTGVITLSNPTRNVEITATCVEIQAYTITTSVTNGTYSGEVAEIKTNETVTITITPSEHYTLPTSIIVTGAEYEYNSSTGVVTLSNPTENVEITATCVELQTYTITTNVTNGTYSGEVAEIKTNETVTITITPSENYSLPTSITVTGAEYEYNNSTGVITLSNPTENVEITATCVELQTYTITTNVTNGTYSGEVAEIKTNETVTITITPSENYSLPTSITVTGAEYEYNNSTGVITLSNPTGNVEITAVCTEGEYLQIVLDGDENWAFNTGGEPNGHGFYNCYLIDSSIVPARNLVALESVYASDIRCSDSRFVMVNEARTDTDCLGLGYFAQDPSIYFRFDSSIATSVEGFKAWLAENPITVYIKKA